MVLHLIQRNRVKLIIQSDTVTYHKSENCIRTTVIYNLLFTDFILMLHTKTLVEYNNITFIFPVSYFIS